MSVDTLRMKEREFCHCVYYVILFLTQNRLTRALVLLLEKTAKNRRDSVVSKVSSSHLALIVQMSVR